MDYKIIWAPEAAETFDKVIHYLEENWSNKEINYFIIRTEHVIKLIQNNPYLFRASEKENIHEALVTKQNLLLYQINERVKAIELLCFWDARQDPKKKITNF